MTADRLSAPVASAAAGDLAVGEVLDFLSARGQLLPIVRAAISAKMAAAAATEVGLVVTVAELQVAADGFRRRAGLASTAATHRWVADNFLSVAGFEAALERDLLVERFKDHLAAERGPGHLAAHPGRYERVRLRRLVAPSEGAAREFLHQIEHEGVGLADLAGRYDPDPAARAKGGSLGVVGRWQLPPSAEAVFAARPGSVAGPIPTDNGFALFLVEELHTPDLSDPDTAARVRDEVFAAWLTDRLRDVRIDLSGVASLA